MQGTGPIAIASKSTIGVLGDKKVERPNKQGQESMKNDENSKIPPITKPPSLQEKKHTNVKGGGFGKMCK